MSSGITSNRKSVDVGNRPQTASRYQGLSKQTKTNDPLPTSSYRNVTNQHVDTYSQRPLSTQTGVIVPPDQDLNAYEQHHN